MPRTDLSRRIFVLLLSLLGTAALFLPFTYGVSPWDAVREPWRTLKGEFYWGFLLGAPFFLSVPILGWQVRRLFVERLSIAEIAVAYGKALGVALSLMVAAATRSFLRSVSGELPCAILFAQFSGGSHGPDRK